MSITEIQSIIFNFINASLEEDIPALTNIISYNIHEKTKAWGNEYLSKLDNLDKHLNCYLKEIGLTLKEHIVFNDIIHKCIEFANDFKKNLKQYLSTIEQHNFDDSKQNIINDNIGKHLLIFKIQLEELEQLIYKLLNNQTPSHWRPRNIEYLKSFKDKELPAFMYLIYFNLKEYSPKWYIDFENVIDCLITDNPTQINQEKCFKEYHAAFYKIILDDSFKQLFYKLLDLDPSIEISNSEDNKNVIEKTRENKQNEFIEKIMAREKDLKGKDLELLEICQQTIYFLGCEALGIEYDKIESISWTNDGLKIDRYQKIKQNMGKTSSVRLRSYPSKIKISTVLMPKNDDDKFERILPFEDSKDAFRDYKDGLWAYLIQPIKKENTHKSIPRLLDFLRIGGSLLVNKIAGDRFGSKKSYLKEVMENWIIKLQPQPPTTKSPKQSPTNSSNTEGAINGNSENQSNDDVLGGSTNDNDEQQTSDDTPSTTTGNYIEPSTEMGKNDQFLFKAPILWAYFELLERIMTQFSTKQYECWLLQFGYAQIIFGDNIIKNDEKKKHPDVSADDASAIIACLTRDSDWREEQDSNIVYSNKRIWSQWLSTQQNNDNSKHIDSVRASISQHLKEAADVIEEMDEDIDQTVKRAVGTIYKIHALIYKRAQQEFGRYIGSFIKNLRNWQICDENYNDRLQEIVNNIIDKDLKSSISLLRLMACQENINIVNDYLDEEHICDLNEQENRKIKCPQPAEISLDKVPELCRICHYRCVARVPRKAYPMYKMIHEYFTQSQTLDNNPSDCFVCQDLWDVYKLPNIFTDLPINSVISNNTYNALELKYIEDNRKKLINRFKSQVRILTNN